MSVDRQRLTPPKNDDDTEVRFSIDEAASDGDTKLVLERGRERVPFRVDDGDEATFEGVGEVPEWCVAVISRLGLTLDATA